MVDSGAYHHARGISVRVAEYARLASMVQADFVVGPDVIGDPHATLERSIEFAEIYPGPFIPVAQPLPSDGVGSHVASAEDAASRGLIDRAPKVPGGRLLGIGGLA